VGLTRPNPAGCVRTLYGELALMANRLWQTGIWRNAIFPYFSQCNIEFSKVSSEDPSLSDLNQDEDEDDYDKYKVFTATEKLTAATSVIGLTKNNQVIADHYKVFNNPWFSQNMSDMVGSGKQTLQNCEYRSFSNHSFFSVPEFIPEYIKFRGKRPFHIQTKARQIIGIFTFKDCIRQPGVAANEWLNQRLSASIGNKGEFSLDTSRYQLAEFNK